MTNKGAAKGLRGRSFYVGHFCRLCADYLLKTLGLNKAGLLYNSGGKFYLLLPAHLRPSLYETRDRINQWMLARFGGDVFLGLGLADVTAPMFEQGGMHDAWKTAADDLELDRTRKFEGLLTMPGFFDPEKACDPTTSCNVCGSRRISRGEGKCAACHELEAWGAALRRAGAILTVWGTHEHLELPKPRLSFQGLNATCHMISEHDVERRVLGKLSGIDCELMLLNRLGERPFTDIALPGCAVTTMYVGKWESDRQVKVSESGREEPWDFNNYAENSQGIKRLGILRMDVDNLGMVFIKGLRFPERDNRGWGAVVEKNGVVQRRWMASISRMVTLSRQLNHFFSGCIPRLLEKKEFNQCQIIYAGGDDLFVIGSWHQLPELAETVRSEFKTFCCQNPVFSISGGVTLHRAGYPIYKGALMAGQAEKQAKELRQKWQLDTNAGINRKDSFCFLGVPVVWEDFQCVKQLKMMLLKESDKNKGLLAYLIRMTAGNIMLVHELNRRRGIGIPDAWKAIQYTAWYWRTAYQLRRRYKDSEMRARWADVLFSDRFDEAKTKLPVYSWLALPLRWADYLQR